MKRFQLNEILVLTVVVAIACQPLSDSPQANQPVNQPATTNLLSTPQKAAGQTPQKIAPPSPVATQVISMNAYKVPYLGFKSPLLRI